MISRVVDEALAANTYVCDTGVAGAALVVDPGLNGDLVESELERRGLRARWVLLTHGHFDHIASAHRLQVDHGAEVWLHGADQRVAERANFLLMACRLPHRIAVPRIDHLATDGSAVAVGEEKATFLHTPGHSPGSCCIRWRDTVFTGDTVYRGHVGRDKFPGEDPAVLRATLLGLWTDLDDDWTIRPGHGDSGRWGEIKANNTALRQLVGVDTERGVA